jgi:hypothetical protein
MQVRNLVINSVHTISHCSDLTLHDTELAGKTEFHLLSAVVKSFLQPGNCAFPASAFISAESLWLDSKDIATEVFLLKGFAFDNDNIVGENFDLFLEGRLLLDFRDTGESVTHDGDEHVQEGDLGDEGGCDENYPDNHIVALPFVIIQIELSKREHILVHNHIDEPDVEHILV